MANVSIAIDLDHLLAPISEGAPAGAHLRYEGTYDRIREARREDDPTLPQGVWVTRLKSADWKGVTALCAEALEHRSKDLQLAVWLAEAWVQIHGFGGVASGVRLVSALCDRYWDTLFPALGDEGPEPRANLISWQDEVLARKLRLFPLAEIGEDQPPYTLADWEAGRRPGAPPAEGAELPGAEAFLARASLLDRSRWTSLFKAARAGLVEVDALERALAAHMESPPVLHRVRTVLRSLENLIEATIGLPQEERLPDVAAPAGGADSVAQPRTPGEVNAPRLPGAPLQSRADAYRQLTEAADYLLRTEPHSPVPYLVKRAISWGNMSLAELLAEFVASPDDLVSMYRLLGIRGRDES
ncbi:type VI secretion system protein TssA [Chondromyces apiculatus]|uniref:ImpA N-terminal domain-containing protein n=1 Tax=Chondromyces apiculatus DSM 436 TaxID=1192034 RepID=A0A017T0V8_9BACT|nr:type VI secretion system protein TssA [Chondromyces apiculatus]EYF02863.1 Hypothetical protein CAP_6443 [Chondromyces apiculatus DSM 436]